MMPMEARLVRVPAYKFQRPKTSRRAAPVEQRRTVTTTKLSRTIYEHLCHRSHPTIKGNSKVRERYSSVCPASYIPSTDVVISAFPDPGQEVLHPAEDETNTTDEKKPDWKPTASATAELFLPGVRDAADAFSPLKSVARGLYFILDNCEV